MKYNYIKLKIIVVNGAWPSDVVWIMIAGLSGLSLNKLIPHCYSPSVDKEWLEAEIQGWEKGIILKWTAIPPNKKSCSLCFFTWLKPGY